MGGDEFKYGDMMCKFDFLNDLIILEYKNILGHVLSEESEVVAEASDSFELMLETHQSGEFLLVAVDLVDKLVGQNQAVLLVKVVVFAFLQPKYLVVFLEGHPLLCLLNWTPTLRTLR
jgi:hypothetical protein